MVMFRIVIVFALIFGGASAAISIEPKELDARVKRIFDKIITSELPTEESIVGDADFIAIFGDTRSQKTYERIIGSRSPIASIDFAVDSLGIFEIEDKRHAWEAIARIELMLDAGIEYNNGKPDGPSTDDFLNALAKFDIAARQSEAKIVEFKSVPDGASIIANRTGSGFPRRLPEKTKFYYTLRAGEYRFVCETINKSVEKLVTISDHYTLVEFELK